MSTAEKNQEKEDKPAVYGDGGDDAPSLECGAIPPFPSLKDFFYCILAVLAALWFLGVF
jgi:hypothetical protein